jgi:predicted choloylglycine hydrolase
MYHPRLKGCHYKMGQKMGNIFKKYNAKFLIKLDPFQIRFGKESTKLLKQFFPEAADEIKGITDVLGINNELFASWMMCMGCCLDIQNEDFTEVRGCTVFSFIKNNLVYYARNNDLPPFLRKISKSIYYKPENKNSFILNTSSFVNGEEGINQYGLVVAMTFVMPKPGEIIPGINSVFLVRYLLENCRTVDEGINILKKLPIASSCNIILTDKSKKMLVAECNPLKIHIRHPEKSKNGKPFTIAVNHFTSEEMWQHDASSRNIYFSKIRYQTVYDALKNMDYNDGVKHSINILSGKYGFICQYDKKLNFDTIWSSVFNISDNKIYIAEGNPKKNKYKEDIRLGWVK